ncbi:acyl-CoA carboxylase [Pueribacillus theae]|uniref:Acyl-CoA carboxylase n=1 Tax=Pueribacillus theae TaxID=2171751 RepID=A0A2U1JKW2_9BACI|nr:carboxyl transferase domain-containing protein [Pueribacillus theae]PWA05790.1 acyl-CoA carboxylase [Pueribacillus theae]
MTSKTDRSNSGIESGKIYRLLDELSIKKGYLLDEQRSEAIKKQHRKGKLSARERINLLIDEGTFIELGMLVQHEGMEMMRGKDTPADGIVAGIGEVDGRTVAVIANDPTVLGGSIGKMGMEKQQRVVKTAKESGFPLVFLMEGGGHRIQEGLDSREFAREINLTLFQDLSLMSGWVPLIGAIFGDGFAGPANFASLCDFIPIVKDGTIGIAGPKLVKSALGEDLSKEELGGATFQTKETGMADLIVDSDEDCISEIKKYLSYFPSNANQSPQRVASEQPVNEVDQAILSVLPDSLYRVYDMSKVLNYIFDKDSMYEMKPQYAKNIITAFARINGKTIGIVANQPFYKGGIMDAAACTKASRFVSLCDAFNIPLITFIDVAGFMPGRRSETEGLVRKAGKLQFEFAQITVPKISVVVRKGYGFAYIVLGSQSNYTVAWPTAEICAMGIEGAVEVAYHKEISQAENPVQRKQDLIKKFQSQTGAMRGGEGFGVDDVINPLDTRFLIAKSLERFPEKLPKQFPPRKHGISPI